MRPKALFVIGIVLAISHGCAATQGGSSGAGYGGTGYRDAGYRSCAANFSIVRGQHFRTFEDFPGLTPSAAIGRIAASMHANGYQVTTVDRGLGTLSAMHEGTYIIAGHIDPLHALIRSAPRGGARVELGYSLAVAQSRGANAESIRHELCKLLELLSS